MEGLKTKEFTEYIRLSWHSPKDYREAYAYGLRKFYRAQFGEAHGDREQDKEMCKLSYTGLADGLRGQPPKRDAIKKEV